jgi:cell pole-organizing protein PopZ
MRQHGEPSVEEILESIKKVIARDNRENAEEDRRRRENDSRSPAAEREEVLELDAEAELPEETDEDGGDDDAPLVDRIASDAMRESLAALAVLAEPGVPPQIVRSGETSLEGLVRELLRPMLADWLDRHLPAMVERMVAAEIARIAGKKG